MFTSDSFGSEVIMFFDIKFWVGVKIHDTFVLLILLECLREYEACASVEDETVKSVKIKKTTTSGRLTQTSSDGPSSTGPKKSKPSTNEPHGWCQTLE